MSDAIKLPILISYSTKLEKCKGSILLNFPIKLGTIKIGFGGVPIFDKSNKTIFTNYGIITFNGKCNIGHGSKIIVNHNGDLSFGHNFNITAHSSIICRHKISFGDNCLISWDNLFMDSDFHNVYDMNTKEKLNPEKPINIGNNVWIGCRCTILKGTTVLDNNVISANTTLFNYYTYTNSIIGGNPPKILRNNINWKT